MPNPLGDPLWIAVLSVLPAGGLIYLVRRLRAKHAPVNETAPLVCHSPNGIPELDVPPGAIVVWWPSIGRWAYYLEHDDTRGRNLLQMLKLRRRSAGHRADQILSALMAEGSQDLPAQEPSAADGTGRSWLHLVRGNGPRRNR